MENMTKIPVTVMSTKEFKQMSALALVGALAIECIIVDGCFKIGSKIVEMVKSKRKANLEEIMRNEG